MNDVNYAEEFVNHVDSDEIKELYANYEKKHNGNRALATREIGITPPVIYSWDITKGDVKHSTKVKILEKMFEKYPAETFEHITQNLYEKCNDTLLSCLSTMYEKTFGVTSEKEYLNSVHAFESITEKYAGQIYHQNELEVNNMYFGLSQFAKSNGYNWKPNQTVLYNMNEVKAMIPQIISSWVYYGLPQTAEELANRTKFPLEMVNDVVNTLQSQLSPGQMGSLEGMQAGIYLEGEQGMMMSTAGTLKRPTKSLK